MSMFIGLLSDPDAGACRPEPVRAGRDSGTPSGAL
jgi:hypothetical protein